MIFDEENFPSLPPTWESMLVDDACKNVAIKAKLPTKEYLPTGALQVIDQGEKPIGGYTNDQNLSVTEHLPVIVFGDHTRALKYITMPFAAGADGIKVLHPNECYEARLFFRFLQAVRLPDKGYARHFQHLRSSHLSLPPLPEQKRIADKLDSVLARVDACLDRLDRLPALLKRFRQSILATAISGRLTEDWRDNTQRDWSSTKLGLVAKFIDYRGKTPTKTASGTPLITAKNVRRGFVSFEPREFIAESDYDAWMTRGFPSKDDVLITTEAPLGNVAVINWDFKFALAQRVICLQFNKQIIGSYAAIALQSNLFQAQLSEQSTGSTVAGIKASRLKQLQIEIPSIEEQTEIVRRVEILFAFADRLEARLASARRQVGQLTPALLAKAFRGELVAQDPADEPAAELLKRLAAQREAAPKAKRTRAKS